MLNISDAPKVDLEHAGEMSPSNIYPAEDLRRDPAFDSVRSKSGGEGAGETASDRGLERGAEHAHHGQADFEDAVDGLDDIVTGMNAFVDDSRAGPEGAEVEPVGGQVQFDVDKFMSLLNGEDLMWVDQTSFHVLVYNLNFFRLLDYVKLCKRL